MSETRGQVIIQYVSEMCDELGAELLWIDVDREIDDEK